MVEKGKWLLGDGRLGAVGEQLEHESGTEGSNGPEGRGKSSERSMGRVDEEKNEEKDEEANKIVLTILLDRKWMQVWMGASVLN